MKPARGHPWTRAGRRGSDDLLEGRLGPERREPAAFRKNFARYFEKKTGVDLDRLKPLSDRAYRLLDFLKIHSGGKHEIVQDDGTSPRFSSPGPLPPFASPRSVQTGLARDLVPPHRDLDEDMSILVNGNPHVAFFGGSWSSQ